MLDAKQIRANPEQVKSNWRKEVAGILDGFLRLDETAPNPRPGGRNESFRNSASRR